MKLGGIKIQVLMAAALLGLSGLRAAASTMNDSHNELAEAIDTFVEQAHRELSFHGNVEVRLAGDVIYKRSLGLANAEFDVPHSERSRFMIASVSKQFTAAMILKLQELGKLDIHKPLSTYIEPQANSFHPDTLEGWRQVTLHQLMSHTAGAMRDVRFTEYYSNQTYEPFLSSIVLDMARNYNLFPGEIGQQARYSNIGYVLLAYVVESVTKMEFHDALQLYLGLPLALESTGQFHRMFHIKYMADGYNYADGVEDLRKRCCFDATSFVGSHSLYSDVDDLMTWLDDLFSGRSEILTEESIQLMTSAHAPMKWSENEYGYGFFVDEVNGVKRVWHDGFEYGYLSLVSVLPELDLKIVILGNRHNAEVNYNRYYTQELNNKITNLMTSH